MSPFQDFTPSGGADSIKLCLSHIHTIYNTPLPFLLGQKQKIIEKEHVQ